ncbi:YlxR family protein [Irregularibacter muris]|uniref:YlxR family protein n=1 Tax=Irregularibacter muris TaxID=1796619 RepID=A0AAE3HD20_9FIRM|nr:YlxR family protein [Irregularibacter muris]MCR1898107.1 YlxR family protein [Irregularibacter muris]
MLKRKIPQRICIGCQEAKDKKQLIRIVRNKEGEVFYDSTGKANGRGAYICKNIDCFDAAIKNKKIEKAFNKGIDETIKNRLRDEIFNE